jgi:predicted ATPase
LGEHEACCEHVAQGLALYDAGDYRLHGTLYGGHDPKVCALGERALSQWLLGYPDQAMKSASSAVAYAEELEHSGSIGHARDLEIMLHRYRGDPVVVLEKADAMMALAEAQGLNDLTAKAKIFKGWALAAQGNCHTGIALMNEGLAQERAIGTEEDFPVYYEMLAEVHGKLGQPEQGMALLDEALTMAERTGARYWSAELFRRKGDLLLISRVGSVSEAIKCFDRAIEIAEAQSARTLRLRAALSKAQVLATHLRRAEARELLEWAGASLPEEFDTADLCEARRLLDELA